MVFDKYISFSSNLFQLVDLSVSIDNLLLPLQDAIDLFLGNYVVEEGRLAPRIDRGWKYLLVRITMFSFHFFFLLCGMLLFFRLASRNLVYRGHYGICNRLAPEW